MLCYIKESVICKNNTLSLQSVCNELCKLSVQFLQITLSLMLHNINITR